MTPAQLRAILATMLDGLIGTYTTKAGNTFDALRTEEPESDWTVSGLEVIIGRVPDVSQTPAYNRGFISETHQVRLVSHGSTTNTLAALKKILSRFPRAQASTVPENERLGILAQHVITIPIN